MTLAEAALELQLDTSTLRRQIARGSLRARKVGPVWTVTRREVERYRAASLGQHHNRRPARRLAPPA